MHKVEGSIPLLNYNLSYQVQILSLNEALEEGRRRWRGRRLVTKA